MAFNTKRLKTIAEHKDERFVSKGWEDFDHSQKFSLGVRGSTWTVRDKETSEQYVLQSCHQSAWTTERYKLLRIGRKWTDCLVPPRFMFFRKDWVYICSELGGVCLADIIDSTTSPTEAQTATIVVQVIRIMMALANAGNWYRFKASNIFVSEDGRVRLASFGRRIEPEKYGQHHALFSCEHVGHLVYHMLTRLPKIDQADFEPWQQMMTVRTKSVDIPVSIDHQLSAGFFDFIQACMGGGNDLGALLTHGYLQAGAGTSGAGSVLPLVRHTAETSLTGHRLAAFGRYDARQKQVLHATKHVMDFDPGRPGEEEGVMDWERSGERGNALLDGDAMDIDVDGDVGGVSEMLVAA